VASYDETIPPGRAGKITLTVDTRGYTGKVTKSAKIYINNPRDKFHYISVEAFIRPAIVVSPENVQLYGKPGEVVEKIVEIRAEKKKALRLEPIAFDLEQKVTYTVEEVARGKHYRVHFKNRPGPPEIFVGFLKLKTNYPEKPEVTIRIRGKFRD
jgi:hypothetical protein